MQPSFDVDEGLGTRDVVDHYDPVRPPVVSETCRRDVLAACTPEHLAVKASARKLMSDADE